MNLATLLQESLNDPLEDMKAQQKAATRDWIRKRVERHLMAVPEAVRPVVTAHATYDEKHDWLWIRIPGHHAIRSHDVFNWTDKRVGACYDVIVERRRRFLWSTWTDETLLEPRTYGFSEALVAAEKR